MQIDAGKQLCRYQLINGNSLTQSAAPYRKFNPLSGAMFEPASEEVNQTFARDIKRLNASTRLIIEARSGEKMTGSGVGAAGHDQAHQRPCASCLHKDFEKEK